MTEKLSIIVPSYNAEKTISRCISSIRNQTYQNLEIIVINDGSTDNTESIVEKLCCDDCRIKLVTIKNGGVSNARNTGIDIATGDYITFVDSDDYIDAEMYENLISLAVKYQADITHCSYKNVDENGNVLSVVGNKGQIVVQDSEEAIECLLGDRLFAGGLCNKIYKAHLFKDVRLENGIKYNEDVLANFELFKRSGTSVYTDCAFYYYVATTSSSTHTASGIGPAKQKVYVAEKIYNMSLGKSYSIIAEKNYADRVLSLYQSCTFAKDKQNKREAYQQVVEFKKKGFYQNKRDRIVLMMCRLFPGILRKTYFIYDRIRVKKLDPVQ